MYSNEGAVDPTAVKMSQMVGVFLTGLGLAAVTMRPATVDASDLMAIRGDIASSIAGLKGSINEVNTSVDGTNKEINSLVHTLGGLDLSAIAGAADAVLSVSQQLQQTAAGLKVLIEELDLSADVDLSPVISQIMSSHTVEMKGIADLMSQLNSIGSSGATQWETVRDDLVDKIAASQSSMSEQISGLMDQLSELDVEVDLAPVLNATEEVRAVAQQHSSNFDSFVNALIG